MASGNVVMSETSTEATRKYSKVLTVLFWQWCVRPLRQTDADLELKALFTIMLFTLTTAPDEEQ